MRSSVAVLGLLCGCGFHSPAAPGEDPEPTVDAAPPVADGCATFSTQFDTCTLAFEGDLMVSGMATYDTDAHQLVVDGMMMPVHQMVLSVGGSRVDVIYAHSVTLAEGATLRAIGALPFAVVTSDSIMLASSASIDVSAGGAGARASCANGPRSGENDTGGAGGGGGGGYGADGGNGGGGNSDHSVFGRNSRGGAAGRAVTRMPSGPTGGCPGGRGGNGDSPGGAGGAGGGALDLIAAGRIELGMASVLTAGGGGGSGGSVPGGDAGGGGGGSGGMIILEAPQIVGAQATVAANGGGGGEGSDSSNAGDPGDAGSLSTSRTNGGSGNAGEGADGGPGGSQESSKGDAVTNVLKGGGGGGGGGVGFVHVVSANAQLGTVSPAAN